MRASTVAATSLSLLASLASARIYGFAAPSEVAVGTEVEFQIIAQDYIQSIQDVAIAFGAQPAGSASEEILGTLIGEKFLGPGKSLCFPARMPR